MTVQRWSDEYEKFLNVNASLPPLELSEKVRAKVFASLKPSASWVLGKIALLHAMSVTVTLLFCPQFGINPLNTSGLMSVFMKFGSMFCMVPCGATVIGISLIFSALFLKREEFRYLKRLEYWVLPGLAFTTLGFFSVYGEWVMLEMVALWFAGAMLGGKAALELVTYFHDKQALVSI